jgi:hypothetical protein
MYYRADQQQQQMNFPLYGAYGQPIRPEDAPNYVGPRGPQPYPPPPPAHGQHYPPQGYPPVPYQYGPPGPPAPLPPPHGAPPSQAPPMSQPVGGQPQSPSGAQESATAPYPPQGAPNMMSNMGPAPAMHQPPPNGTHAQDSNAAPAVDAAPASGTSITATSAPNQSAILAQPGHGEINGRKRGPTEELRPPPPPPNPAVAGSSIRGQAESSYRYGDQPNNPAPSSSSGPPMYYYPPAQAPNSHALYPHYPAPATRTGPGDKPAYVERPQGTPSPMSISANGAPGSAGASPATSGTSQGPHAEQKYVRSSAPPPSSTTATSQSDLPTTLPPPSHTPLSQSSTNGTGQANSSSPGNNQPNGRHPIAIHDIVTNDGSPRVMDIDNSMKARLGMTAYSPKP